MTRRLTAKQEAFAVAYVKSGNASAAYRKIYDAKKMKAAVVHVAACQLLKNPKVSVRIDELRAPAFEATKIDIETWARETVKYAFGQPSEELKHGDKRGYLDMVGKHVGAYKEDNLQQGVSLALKIVAATPVKKR